MTIAELIASGPEPHQRAIACFSMQDHQRYHVVYTFADGSTLRFNIEYTLS